MDKRSAPVTPLSKHQLLESSVSSSRSADGRGKGKSVASRSNTKEYRSPAGPSGTKQRRVSAKKTTPRDGRPNSDTRTSDAPGAPVLGSASNSPVGGSSAMENTGRPTRGSSPSSPASRETTEATKDSPSTLSNSAQERIARKKKRKHEQYLRRIARNGPDYVSEINGGKNGKLDPNSAQGQLAALKRAEALEAKRVAEQQRKTAREEKAAAIAAKVAENARIMTTDPRWEGFYDVAYAELSAPGKDLRMGKPMLVKMAEQLALSRIKMLAGLDRHPRSSTSNDAISICSSRNTGSCQADEELPVDASTAEFMDIIESLDTAIDVVETARASDARGPPGDEVSAELPYLTADCGRGKTFSLREGNDPMSSGMHARIRLIENEDGGKTAASSKVTSTEASDLSVGLRKFSSTDLGFEYSFVSQSTCAEVEHSEAATHVAPTAFVTPTTVISGARPRQHENPAGTSRHFWDTMSLFTEAKTQLERYERWMREVEAARVMGHATTESPPDLEQVVALMTVIHPAQV